MNDDRSQSGVSWPAVGMVLLGLASLVMLGRLSGCGQPQGDRKEPVAADHGDPAALLRRVIDKYQQAASYSDQGELKLLVSRHGRAMRPQAWPAAVKFVRPGRLRIDAYNLHLASDATASEPLLVAQVEDAESNNIDQQVVARPAPARITSADLTADPILFSQLIGRIQRPPVQLELLLGEKPLATLLSGEAKLSWLADAEIEVKTYRRIVAASSEGKFVLWIDPEELLLRRVEYPATALLPDLAGDKAVSEASLIADLTGATFAPPPSDAAFTMEIPNDAKRMRAFVMPVIALDAKLLGQPVRAFEFTQLDGEKITPADVEGKITALFWYAHHPACEEAAQQFAKAVENFGDDQQAFAICTELPEVGDKAVRDQLKVWKVDLPAARDLRQYHERVFQVRELPSITLLDAQGRFQWMGSGTSAIAEFPEAMARLAKGEDLAATALQRERLAREQYQRLVAAGGPRLDTGPTPASLPKRLKLAKKWKVDRLTSAGTVLPAPGEDDRKSVLVVAGPQSVWELSGDGEVLAKHAVPLPEKAEVTALRTFASAKQQPVYAVFTPLQPAVHVLDADWKLLFRYPAGDDSPPVRDVQWTDLNADGEPELLVAFEESAGLHSVLLSGERQWNNRSFTPLLSIAPSHKMPVIGYCAYVTGRGGICPIAKDGLEGLVKDVPGWVVAHVFTARFGEGTQAAYAAIGAGPQGEPCLIGLSPVLEEQWNYPLPDATFRRPVDFVASGRLRADSEGEWVAGWGDGSLHIVSEDGTFDDMFHIGQEIRGVAVVDSTERPLLVVTTPTEVLAWEVRGE